MKFQELTDLVFSRYYTEAKSYKTSQIILKELVELIGAKTNIKNINVSTIDTVISRLDAKGNTHSSINRKLAILSKCLTYAYDRGEIDRKPKIEKLKESNNKLRYISEEEEQQILQYFDDKADCTMYAFCSIALNTGMRLSEILNLRPNDIEDGYIRIYENKADHPRSIPLNDKAKEAIKMIIKDGLFENINKDYVIYRFKKAVTDLGITEVSVHTMRHTFCSRLVQKNVDLYTVQKLAGHKSSTMTQRYAHLNNKNLEAAVAVL